MMLIYALSFLLMLHFLFVSKLRVYIVTFVIIKAEKFLELEK